MYLKGWLKPGAGSSLAIARWRPLFAASSDEAALYEPLNGESAPIADYLRERNPAAALRIRFAIYETLQNILLFPYAGRLQTTETVRKLVTRRYGYIIYYAVDEAADEIVLLSIQHPAREREHQD
ncbi:MAG TPA: type II toxin-antitoxin system RelE/ParE family toxin [Pseudolabrys sp.]|nr:type II toxin-antitoxin system RelE/ParE family toxin [Pseudolabrys sp.]